MDIRESAETMKSPATKDEDEIQIAIRGTSMSISASGSESPSSSSYARSDSHQITINPPNTSTSNSLVIERKLIVGELRTIACTCCGHHIPLHHQADILNDLPGMPAGVKFDPSDVEILEHLEAKAKSNSTKLHPLIDQFIPTLKDDNGICYTHPENLPGVSKDGVIRHFFHRPSKAYTTGSRKRRKVQNNEDDGSGGSGETRWHKTGKTRAVVFDGQVKGFKKILVLYTNYGRQRKPEKTNWVMHQYHIGQSEEEKDGELVLSKVFYQTQPRHVVIPPQRPMPQSEVGSSSINGMNLDQYYHHHQQQLEPQLFRHGDGSSSLVSLDGRHKEKEQFEGDTTADHK